MFNILVTSNFQGALKTTKRWTEATHQRISSEKVFLKYAANFQENTHAEVQFIEITLRHGCSNVNLLHISRTPFCKNTSGGLLLDGNK